MHILTKLFTSEISSLSELFYQFQILNSYLDPNNYYFKKTLHMSNSILLNKY
jgi:hypothetical protein